jgi:hypothetical protein
MGALPQVQDAGTHTEIIHSSETDIGQSTCQRSYRSKTYQNAIYRDYARRAGQDHL